MSRKESNSKRVATTARQRRETNLQQNSKRSSRSSQGSARRRRREERHLNPLWFIGGLILCVVIVVGVFIYIADHQPIAGVVGPTDPQVLNEVTHIKPSVFAQVNTGVVRNTFQTTGSSQLLTGQGGKPEIFYYGAEFCPYCGAQRWSLVAALSRFGTFSKLPEGLSSEQDVNPNTPTFTFVGSQYTSSYIDFVPVEAEDRDHKTLQTPAPHEAPILKQYNVNGFPFLDIANRYVATNPPYDPSLLQGLSQKDIASRLSDPSDSLAQNIVGGANYLTAAICLVTNNKPANVCNQPPTPGIVPFVIHSPSLSQPQADIPTDRPMALSTGRRKDGFSA
jgi:thiol-disulfide isomerase/thioredoxin